LLKQEGILNMWSFESMEVMAPPPNPYAFSWPLLILCSILLYYYVIEGFPFLPACKLFVSAGTPSGSVAYHRWLAADVRCIHQKLSDDLILTLTGPLQPPRDVMFVISIVLVWSSVTLRWELVFFCSMGRCKNVLTLMRNVSVASVLKDIEAMCSSAVLVPIRLHDVVM